MIIKTYNMKKYISYILAIVLLASCSKSGDPSDPGTNPPPPISNPPGPDDVQITSIDLTYGYTDDAMQITGKNFGKDINAITAKINGVVATIFPAGFGGGSTCVIKVPAKCGTGPVTLTRNGKTATGPSFFYIPSANVTTLYGKSGVSGDANGSGTNMRMVNPTDFVFDKNNNIYVTDQGHASSSPRGAIVRKITAAGTISTFSGGPLNATTSNDNTPWALGLPAGGGTVNGGDARYKFAYGIGISEDPNSNAFRLFVADHAFLRNITESSNTGVYAGVVKDSTGGGGSQVTGNRYDSHLVLLGGISVVPNAAAYASPEIYFLDAGPRIAKIDAAGNVSTFINLAATPGGFFSRLNDGSFFLHAGGSTKKIYKISSTGVLSTWINTTDSLHNQASGLNESFGYQVEDGSVQCMTADKNGHLFLIAVNSAYDTFIEIFPDKSFIRRNQWHHIQPATDGLHGNIPGVQKMIIKDNGEVYVLDYFSIRKIIFE